MYLSINQLKHLLFSLIFIYLFINVYSYINSFILMYLYICLFLSSDRFIYSYLFLFSDEFIYFLSSDTFIYFHLVVNLFISIYFLSVIYLSFIYLFNHLFTYSHIYLSTSLSGRSTGRPSLWTASRGFTFICWPSLWPRPSPAYWPSTGSLDYREGYSPAFEWLLWVRSLDH